ncbi:hypothetical protein [Streptomyces sp. ML-6]|uniref:hypothetical protein n=1 Tax=unclassified Streptomyces TaxID=2593676 RepID=UPI0024BFB84A|nr:hypothetical protein [Streptomyces sp. ML-6]MDK0517606.1 hypothetical protein [Streptomyces sp. ML-6]
MPGTIDEAGQAAVEPALQDDTDSSDATGTSPFTDGVRLYVPGAHQTSLVLCGAGAERTLARAPALASRVLTWQHVPRLDSAQVPGVLRLFHPLWDTATDADLLHTDETRAHGNFRT